ncbi:hypothetical protein DdX_16609 [Ditylenchus destructor]|uniref:Uncharacterized protein n=1 Tax=Ditylenchus destructor TaxID=166010 RepID=A0AAD4MTB0_9BILA|nr:hypothetical protein DdX_16609 [Ditylenchus destructor]
MQTVHYRLRDKSVYAKGEIKQCIDSQEVLIQFDSKGGVIFDEIKQVDVEQNGKSVHCPFHHMVYFIYS